MAIHIARHSQQSVQNAEYCKPFLKLFLEMILSQRVGKENIPSISTVLFGLISAFTVKTFATYLFVHDW